ncbi:MAG TPA: hypothetical protein VED87_04535, partial [Methylocystis sp.]|nr:hypothetical protein [Methylocystis sp.]
MKVGVGKRALLIAAFGAIAALPASQSYAQSDREELHELLARIKKLEAKVAQQDADARKVRKTGVSSNAPVFKGPLEPELGPDKFYYKGITITPGGYFAAEGIYRSRYLGQDMATTWNNIPFIGLGGNTSLNGIGSNSTTTGAYAGNASETRFS